MWERDGGRCVFVGAGGHQCGSTYQLERSHVDAHSKGGGNTPPNVRYLCASHNLFEARQEFGAEFIARFTEKPDDA